MSANSANSPNLLLATMAADDRARLDRSLEAIPLPLRKVLEMPGRPIEYAYFPESGLASVVVGKEPRRIEVGIIGREGMVGLNLVHGDDVSPYETFIQQEGEGLRIEAVALRGAMDRSLPLRLHLLKFVNAFTVQTAHTALSNGHYALEDRLARWLLMSDDRADSEEMVVTHDFLALMLGVRRPGVTLAIHALEGRGLITAHRKSIAVVDRPGLERQAGASYGAAEAQYERLVGRPVNARPHRTGILLGNES